MFKTITLKPTKEKSILRRHPWVFSGAIKAIENGISNGDIVEIKSNKGRFLGFGHYNEGSIAIRIFELNPLTIDIAYWEDKIKKAISQRHQNLDINRKNNIYRLIHAEGDEMPGCIIDRYNNVIVMQFHSVGMWKLKEIFSKAIAKQLPEIDVIYDKSENTLPDIQDISSRPTALVFGSEGSGLRLRTKQTVEFLVKVPFTTDFGSLNVSNAAAVAFFQLQELSKNSI